MRRVEHVLEVLERIAPSSFAFSFDRIGLQVGSPTAEVSTAVVSLDRSLGAVEFARACNAQLLLSHHPLIFSPIDAVTDSTVVGRTILALAEARIALIAAHTNWDCAQGGINDALCETLQLCDVTPFGDASDRPTVKIVTFVPHRAAEQVVDAMAAAGAGRIGNYERCVFEVRGAGSFLPLDGAKPAVGSIGKIESVEETRVEMLAQETSADQVISALRSAHPYEEPAIDVYPVRPTGGFPAGRIGCLQSETSLGEFSAHVEGALGTKCWTWGDQGRPVRKVAVTGGAADDYWRSALRVGADVFVSGEVRQHIALEASASGFAVMAAGHYATEQPGVARLRHALDAALPEIEWHLFAPVPGQYGRPL